MGSDRRSFLLNACATGICACGFSRFASASEPQVNSAAGAGARPAKDPMPSRWIAALLPQLEQNVDPAVARKVMKACSSAHFEHLGMNETLAPFAGNLDGFLDFLRREWGWVIHHDRTSGVVTIDENKDHCVCPLKHKDVELRSNILCFCSEGIAERMFSAVAGKPVRAEVTSSILRGAKSCQYRIVLG